MHGKPIWGIGLKSGTIMLHEGEDGTLREVYTDKRGRETVMEYTDAQAKQFRELASR